MPEKRCGTCGETKSVTDFQRLRTSSDGLQKRCRSCQAAAAAKWWRERGAVDPGLKRRKAVRRRAHYERNREREIARATEWSYANYEQLLDRQRAYYAADPDKFKARSKAYRQANPEKINEFSARRRTRKRAAFVEAVDPQRVWERDIAICGVCGGWVPPPGLTLAEGADRGCSFTLDHVLPLSKGGTHEYLNVQAAHVSCNQRKHASLPPRGALAAIAERARIGA